MASGSAKNIRELIYDVFAPNYTNIDGNYLFFRGQLNIMTVNGYARLKSSALTGQVVLGTVSQGHRPVNAVRIPCAISNQAYNPPTAMGYLAIADNGEMSVTLPSGNTNNCIYFSCSYVAQL